MEAEGYLRLVGDVFDHHSDIENYGVMDGYRRIRSGRVNLHCRYTFFRSHSSGPNLDDHLHDMSVLLSGSRTVRVEKRAPTGAPRN